MEVQEQHQIIIEKKRKLFLAGFRPQTYRIFIDGQLVQTYEGQLVTVSDYFGLRLFAWR